MSILFKNILIGIFVLIAAVLIVFIILFLHPSVGDNAKTLRVLFTNVDKINIGTRVTYAGHPVGEVVSLAEVPTARTQRIAHNGDIYVYELILKVDSGVNIFNTDIISSRTSGLLGEKNVEITPLPPKAGESLFIVNDQTLYATPQFGLEENLKEISMLSKKADLVLDDLHGVFAELNSLKIISKIDSAINHVVNFAEALDKPSHVAEILNNLLAFSAHLNHSLNIFDATLSNFKTLSEEVIKTWGGDLTALSQAPNPIDRNALALADPPSKSNHNDLTKPLVPSFKSDTSVDALNRSPKIIIQSPQSKATIQNILATLQRAAYNTEDFTRRADQMIHYMQQGQGTLGHLMMQDDFYLRLKALTFKGETIFNDMQRFGLLYQNNKQWQRLQARRLKLVEKLNNPEKFARYFYDEMDQISTSLSTVSMILNEAECCPHSMLLDPEFAKRFADLLRQVEDMEEALKMYNEELLIRCP